MKKYSALSIFFILLFISIPKSAVYFPLDINNIETSDHKLIKYAQSVAAYVTQENVIYDASRKLYYVKKRKLGDAYKLCKDEIFYERVSIASCTGFLISPRLLVTSGHCVYKICDKEKSGFWWFEFTQNNLKSLQQNQRYIEIGKEQLFRCEKHLEHHFEGGAFVDIEQKDYALILLERNVKKSTPLLFRLEGRIEDEARVVTIGHPSGLTKSISDNASITLNIHEHYFSADIDAIDGNSGSPVFNEDTGIVEGIIVRTCTGKPSYFIERKKKIQCRRLNIDKFYYGGTDIVRITSIPNLAKWVEFYK